MLTAREAFEEVVEKLREVSGRLDDAISMEEVVVSVSSFTVDLINDAVRIEDEDALAEFPYEQRS